MKKYKIGKGWHPAQQHLSGKHEVLSLIPETKQNKKYINENPGVTAFDL